MNWEDNCLPSMLPLDWFCNFTSLSLYQSVIQETREHFRFFHQHAWGCEYFKSSKQSFWLCFHCLNLRAWSVHLNTSLAVLYSTPELWGRSDSGKLSSISLVPVHRQPGWKCAETYIIWAVNEIITRKRKFATLFQKSPFAIKKLHALEELGSLKESF